VLRVLAVGNYRSLRHLVMPLGPLNVVTGANGSGKSSLYRALRLLADSSRNGAVAALAREGGLTSTLWAGPAQGTSEPGRWAGGPKQVALRLGFAGDEFGYAIDLGLPVSNQSMFGRDPEIKAESLWHGPVLRPSTVLVERNAGVVQVRSDEGPWAMVERRLRPYDSMLGELSDPRLTPEVLTVREEVRSWRFYDHFRTDATSPARSAQVGTRTHALQADGADLPAAIQTIVESGNGAALAGVVDRAFPGSRMKVQTADGRFELTLSQPGLLRRCGPPSCPTAPCATCCWPPPSSRPDRPASWSSTSPRPACTPTCSARWPTSSPLRWPRRRWWWSPIPSRSSATCRPRPPTRSATCGSPGWSSGQVRR
jgi:predicted ATPase